MNKKHIFAIGLSCISLCGCNHSPKSLTVEPLSEEGEATKLEKKSTALLSQKQRFIDAAVAAQIDPVAGATLHNNLVTYFEEGALMSNMLLDKWFELHLAKDKNYNHSRGVANIVGAAAIATLGLTGAEAEQLALLGIGLGALNAQFDNYSANYLISPDLGEVQKKIDEGRRIRLQQLTAALAADKSLTFARAKLALIDYHKSASRQEIEYIVRKSVSIAKYAPAEPVSIGSIERRDQLISDIKTLLGSNGVILNLDVVQSLYVYLSATQEARAYKPFTEMRSGLATKAFIDAYEKLDTQKQNEFTKLLTQVAPLVNGSKALNAALLVAEAEKEKQKLEKEEKEAIAKLEAEKEANAKKLAELEKIEKPTTEQLAEIVKLKAGLSKNQEKFVSIRSHFPKLDVPLPQYAPPSASDINLAPTSVYDALSNAPVVQPQ